MSRTFQRIGIIGAMQAEIEYLKNQLIDLKMHQFGQAFTIYTGTIGRKEIILSLSGIGKVNAAIASTLVIEHFRPDCVINTGSAGGVGVGLKIGDVVIGEEVAHHDVDVTAFGYQYGQVPQQPERYHSEPKLIQAALSAATAFSNANIHHGLIVSGDAFVHSQEKIASIRTHFADVQAIEMEAAAIAQVCHQFNLPFVIVRAISDSAEESASISFDEFLVQAAKHSAQMVLQLMMQC